MLLQKKQEGLKYQNEREGITTDPSNIKTIKKYNIKLHANTLDNLHEIDKFLRRHKKLKLIQKELLQI